MNEDLAFNFASPADKARWQAAGSPKLASPAGFGYLGPVTSGYDFGGFSYRIGALRSAWPRPGRCRRLRPDSARCCTSNGTS